MEYNKRFPTSVELKAPCKRMRFDYKQQMLVLGSCSVWYDAYLKRTVNKEIQNLIYPV